MLLIGWLASVGRKNLPWINAIPAIPANAIATEGNIAITTESGDILVT
jgi:hypothetical protein